MLKTIITPVPGGNRDRYIIMNKENKNIGVRITLLFIVFFMLFAAAGTVEYADDRYYSIPEAAVEDIRARMGGHATRAEIVSEYEANKDYYEAMASYGLSEISRNF